MISDKERREVASNLRRLSETDSFIGELKPSDEVYDSMCLRAIRATVGKGDIFERLADLVDRPQCHPVDVPFGPCGDTSVGCSVCGEPLTINPFGGEGNKYYRRCYHCGAEVVTDDD